MDGLDDQRDGAPEASGGATEEGPKLSAAFLPYDDERLWVGMPSSTRRARRAKRRSTKQERQQKAAAQKVAERPRVSEPSGPTPARRRRLAAALLSLVLPISAFALTRVLSRDVELPPPPPTTSPTLSPSPVMLELVGLRAERVKPTRVELAWDVPAIDGPVRYEVYRDGAIIARTDQPVYVDTDVEPQESYRYSIAAIEGGETRATSPQLVIAVPPRTEDPPSEPEPPAPSPIAPPSTSPSPSPSETPSPSPTTIKLKLPKIRVSPPPNCDDPTTPDIIEPCPI